MPATTSFNDLGLITPISSALKDLGYETPTPIQEQSVPILMQGDDLLAQAQTGTGKTAAFALPILSHLDLKNKSPQALVIAPTRELAIQVAEAFQSYAKHMKGFYVAPIYGGQDYQVQLRALKRGTHVIVGTPGRVMDHLRRGTLSTEHLKTLVLDEADEMLKMGFIDDIEWILDQIPHEHQTALFSATMPTSIQKVANRYLSDAKKIHIKASKANLDTIEQFYTRVSRDQKVDVLTRYLEVEDVQAAIIFTRTKNGSEELAGKLQARGHAAAALNGDMKQPLRKKVIDQIKRGTLDIVVATDVAARGIDIERVSHVINFDIPHDIESYIHRIGRTGRAGRSGKALLFVTPRERRLLQDIERAVHKPITAFEPPSLKEMQARRNQQLAEKIVNIIEKSKRLGPYHDMVDALFTESGYPATDVAAALAYLMQQSNPLATQEIEISKASFDDEESRPRRNRKKSSSSKPKDKRRYASKSGSGGNGGGGSAAKPRKRRDRG